MRCRENPFPCSPMPLSPDPVHRHSTQPRPRNTRLHRTRPVPALTNSRALPELPAACRPKRTRTPLFRPSARLNRIRDSSTPAFYRPRRAYLARQRHDDQLRHQRRSGQDYLYAHPRPPGWGPALREVKDPIPFIVQMQWLQRAYQQR